MGIDLKKGGRINLTKEFPALKRINFALGWKPNPYDTGKPFDLDASVFLCKLDANGHPKLLSDQHFIFYNHHSEPEGAVNHTGDNRTGEGTDPFDEHIIVELDRLNANIDEISFIVTIHDGAANGQNFGQVNGSVIALFDEDTGRELGRYSLEDDFSNETAVQFGSMVKKDNQWIFKAVGAGYNKGLDEFVVVYGGNLL